MALSGKPFHLIVFFTFGVSLKVWSDTGLIGRELLLYKKMVKNGNRVSFLTYGDKADYKYSDQLGGIKVFPVYAHFKKSRYRVINLITSLFIPFIFNGTFKSADFLKTNQMFGAWVPVMAAFFLRKPLVVRCGFEMLRNLLRDEKNKIFWMLKAILGYTLEFISYTSAETIIISNKSDFNYIQKIFPVQRKKIRLIRNFIDTDHFSPIESFKKDSFNKNKIKRLLFIGRLDFRKNIENLIKAVGISGCELDIVGKGQQKKYFETISKQQGVIVNFIGSVDNREIANIIRGHEVYVLPSLYENNPKTLLEAMSCARVVIGTDVEGIKELIEDGKTGFLSGTEIESIKNAIDRVFSTDPCKLNRIAQNARNYVVSKCSIEKVYNQELEIYK